MTGKVLLTGATGFVGRQVLNILDKSGISTRVIVREGKEGKIAGVNNLESIVYTLDLFSESVEWWTNVCEGIDIIIHVAWYAEPGKYLYADKNIDCLIGTLRFAKGASLAHVRRFVGIGTCFEYDLKDEALSVENPLLPITPYSGAKAAAYWALLNWFRSKQIEFVWCRLFYLYGEGEDPRRLVAQLHKNLSAKIPVDLSSGDQVRDFLDVVEAGRMIADIALGAELGAVNICSGIPITVREFAEKIADIYGRRDLLRFGARPDSATDPKYVVGIKNTR
jgi:nucleoside-diphosphate-sugar epimerase